MPNVAYRSKRPQQIVQYLNNLDTTSKKIDFICSTYFLYNETGLIDDSEMDALQDHIGDVFWPRKIVDGQPVLDVEAAEKAYRILAEIEVQNHIAIGKEYKRIYDSLPEDTDNREAKAAYLTRTTPAFRKNRFIPNFRNLLLHDEEGLDPNRTVKQFSSEAYNNACMYMTPAEKDMFDAGRLLCLDNPSILKGKKLKDVGLSQAEIDKLEKESDSIIVPCLDTNWIKDETMNANPRFMYTMVSNEHMNRMRNQYISLDNREAKLDAIIDGMIADKLSVEVYNINGKLAEKKSINVYNENEKEATFRSVEEFFCPLNPDGTPDFDEFEKRMDAMAGKVAQMRMDHINISYKNDFSKLAKDDIKYTNLRTEPNRIKSDCITEYMDQIMDMSKEKGRIHKRFAEDYAKRKEAGDLSEAFYSRVKSVATNHDVTKTAFYEQAFNPDSFYLNPDTIMDVNVKEAKAKAEIASEINAKKTWLNPPEETASIEDLRKLSNLYEQIQEADHWYHIDGGKFKNFKTSLKEAHDLYQQLKDKDDNELSGEEKAKIAVCKDNTAIASDKYLKGKAERGRHSDMGQDRYDIAFSALDVSCHGFAKKRAFLHNIQHTKHGTRKVSLDEIEKRAGRTQAEQKDYQREQKKKRNVPVASNEKPLII